jgi:HEAT repeat protein
MVESSPAVLPDITSRLTHPDPDIRESAAYALGEIGKSAESTIPNLIPLLQDPKPYVRSSAAKALKKLGYKP